MLCSNYLIYSPHQQILAATHQSKSHTTSAAHILPAPRLTRTARAGALHDASMTSRATASLTTAVSPGPDL
jgi:hypothetical protein